MVRARLATLTMAAGLFLLSGCMNHCPWVSRHRTGHDCGCDGMGSVSAFEGPILTDPAASIAPPPPPTTTAPPPRVITVPQANPTPYTPGSTTGLRRFFPRWWE